MNRSSFWMIKYMNGSVFSKARYMNGVGFEILARTPVPKLPLSYPPRGWYKSSMLTYDVQRTKRALMRFADNIGPDQPALMRRLIRAFVAQADQGLRCLLTKSLDIVVYDDEQRMLRSDCTDAHTHLDIQLAVRISYRDPFPTLSIVWHKSPFLDLCIICRYIMTVFTPFCPRDNLCGFLFACPYTNSLALKLGWLGGAKVSCIFCHPGRPADIGW